MEDPILIIDKVDILLNQLTGHKLLNSIEIVRKLGSGQHGKVILGKDLATKRFVAIKEISRHSKQRVLKRINQKSLKEDENKQAWSSEVENENQEYNFPKRILHEVNVMKRCRNLSPNIIKLFSVFNDTKYSNIYLILEYCYRGEIKWMNTTSVEDNTCKSIDDIVAVVKDITIGLEFLKLHNIIHRDIKPSNLLVDHKGRVKISDFGVSYIVDENKPLQDQQKELNRTVGTPMFLAPELCNLHKYKDSTSINSSNDSINDSIVYNNSIIQRSDNSSVTSNDEEDEKFLFDYKLDMWSFGVTVYCLVFNSLPFIADFEFELFSKVTNDKIVYPDSCLLLNVSSKEQKEKDIVNFIKLVNVMQHRLLIKSPNKRASIEELKHDPVFSIDNFGDNEAEREKFLNFNSQFEKPSYSITFDPPLFDQTTRSKSKRSLNKSDSESTSFANSRFNSLKTINSLASKNSTTVSSITSKTISVQSKNSASTALNESNRSNSNSNINTSKDHARMINSTSSNSIGQTSNNSHTTNNSKKSFGKLRKTFSKLMLLRSSSGSNMDDSTQSSKPSLRIPSSNTDKSSLRMPNSKSMRSISSITSDGTSTTNENVIMNKNVITNYEKSQGAAPDFEKPSFSRLLRKKSSQLLLGRPKSPFGNGNNNNNKSVEELNSPIKFKYSKKKLGGSSLSNESSPHDKQKKSTSKSTPAKHQSISVQEESSPLADISNKFSTVKLVDENDKLLTPEEYKKFQEQRTPINLSGSKKNLINELRNVKQLQTSDDDDGRNPNKGGDVDRDSIYGSDNVKTIETTMDDISEQTPSSVKIDFAKLQDKSKRITNKASISDFSISSFDVESRNNQSIITFNSGDGQLQNFFNKLTAKTADKKDILSDTHSNSSNVFEDYTSNDESIVEEKTHPVFATLQHDSIDSPDGENYGDHNTRLGYPKLVTSAKTYNLKQYVYKSDLFEDDDEEDEDDDFGEHTEAYQPPEELDFNSLLRINKQVDSESSSVDNEQNITSIIDSDDEEEEEDDLETDSEECSIKSEHDYRQSEAYKQRHPLQHINVPRKRHRHHSETRAHPGLRKEDDSVYFTEKNFEKAVTTGPDTFLINKIVNFNNDKEFIVENSKQKDVSATADDENTIQPVSNESSVRNMQSMTDYIQELDSK